MELPSLPKKVQLENKESWNEERSKESADFFTVGYSGRNIEEFISALTGAGVACLVDVRANPVSMYKPDFSKSNLERHLAQSRIAYLHLPDLGVPRDIRGKAMATGDRGAIWQWYDKYVASEFRLHRFFNMAEHPVAFMCTELDPTTCHRHRLSLALEQTGLSSFDL